MTTGHADSRTAEREFDAHRRFLWGLSYRITGSAADADDVVQETFVRALQHAPGERADGWRGWLARVATNMSIDAVRRRRRQAYVGEWLPGLIETGEEATPPGYEPASAEGSTEHRYDLMESVSMAFLLALEKLTPRQRAVLILRDVFDYTLRETAAALGLTVANVKVTHHRARRAMKDYDGARVIPTRAHQARAAEQLKAFIAHLENHDVAALEAMLSDDVRFVSDGGGEFAATLRPVLGRDKVLRLLLGLSAKRPRDARLDIRMLNGEPALVAESRAPYGWAERFVIRIDLSPEGRIRAVHTIVATRKLAGVRFGPEDRRV